MYAVAAACCWRQLNRRMHNKLLLVDGDIGITGGRNYQDDYYDWDRRATTSATATCWSPARWRGDMGGELRWRSGSRRAACRRNSWAMSARLLRTQGVPPLPHRAYRKPERVSALLAQAPMTRR